MNRSLVKLCLYPCAQVIQPTLDDIQQALNKATQSVLDVNRSVAQWGQKRFKMMEINANEDTVQGYIKRTVRATESSKSTVNFPKHLLFIALKFQCKITNLCPGT